MYVCMYAYVHISSQYRSIPYILNFVLVIRGNSSTLSKLIKVFSGPKEVTDT